MFLGKHNEVGILEILTLTGRTKRKRNRGKERISLSKSLKNNCSKKRDYKAINAKKDVVESHDCSPNIKKHKKVRTRHRYP